MKFKITHKLYLITLLPIALIMFLSTENVLQIYKENEASQKLLDFSIFTQVATKLLNDYKIERDISYNYLDDTAQKKDLLKQYKITDKTVKNFLLVKEGIELSHFDAKSYKEILDTQREKILSKKLSIQQIQNFYSDIDSQIMFLIQKQNIKSTNYKVNLDAIALKKLVSLQELASEEGSLLYQVFQKQHVTLDNFNIIQSNNAQQLRIFKDFLQNISTKKFHQSLESIFNSQTQKEIKKYRQRLQEEIYKMRLLAQMRATIGYGGLIHNFKNYVLRKDNKYYKACINQFNTLEKIIAQYKEYSKNNQEEYKKLIIIEDTFNKYHTALIQIHDELFSKTSNEIDNKVKISDSNALNALNDLQNLVIGIDPQKWLSLTRAYQAKLQELQESILSDLSHTLMQLQKESDRNFYTQLLLNIIFIILLMGIASFIGKSIINNLNKLQEGLHNFFSYLNFEIKEPQKIIINSKDELKEMSENINSQLKKIHKNREQDEDFISETTQIVSMMKEGDFGERIYFKPFNPSLIALSSVFNDLILMIQEKIKAQTDELESLNATLSDQVYKQTIELQNQLQELTQFQFAINEGSMVTHSDANGLLLEYNRLFSKTAKIGNEMLGVDSAQLLSDESRSKKIKEIVSFIREKKVYKGILEMKTANNTLFYTNSTIIPLQDTHGNIIDILGLHYDITPVIKSRDKAIAAERSKDEFLSNMSHEIRTPLNAILGFVTVLQKRLEDDKSLYYLDIISKSGQSLLHIINDILDFSKIQSGKFTITAHPFEPFDEFSTAIKLFTSNIYEKKIKYYFYIDANLPECILADNLRIKQILSNLISNAIKFTPENGTIKIKITYNSSNLHISVKDSGIGISEEQQKRIFNAFEQADGSTTRKYGGTGLGLSISSKLAELMNGSLSVKSRENHGSVFSLVVPVGISTEYSRTKFYTDKIRNLKITLVKIDEEDDSALKLLSKYFDDYNVKYTQSDLLELEDSDITIICEHKEAIANILANEKTAIVLETIPTHKYDSYPHIYTMQAPFVPVDVMRVLDDATVECIEGNIIVEEDQEEEIKFEGHILIAEDNKTNQMLIKLLMDDYGITYDMTGDGVEAVEAFKKKHNYNLILTDENMPNLNGIGAMQEIVKYENENNLAHTPIVALTASVLQSDKERFLNAGMDGFIGKPIDEKELQEVLEKYLHVRR